MFRKCVLLSAMALGLVAVVASGTQAQDKSPSGRAINPGATPGQWDQYSPGGRPIAPAGASAFDGEIRQIELESSRLKGTKLSLQLRSDALDQRNASIERERQRVRTQAQASAFKRKVDEYNWLVEKWNRDRARYNEEVDRHNRRVYALVAKIRASGGAAAGGTAAGAATGGGLYFDEYAQKKR